MTLLFFKDTEISPNIGGIARINYTLSHSLKGLGYKALYVGFKKKTNKKDEIIQSWLPDNTIINSEANVEYLHKYINENEVDIIINSYFDKGAFDLIDTSRKKTRAKVITWYHNNIIEYAALWGVRNEKIFQDRGLSWLYKLSTNKYTVKLLKQLARFKHRELAQKAYHKSDKIVVVSEGNIKEFLQLLGENDKGNKVVSISNFVPPITESITEKKNHVVWCGAINFDLKKTNWMLDIWHEVSLTHKDWSLYILGDSLLLDDMKAYAKKLELSRVNFEGRVDPSPYYSSAAILCSTSITESFGLTIVEGMQYGVVPVAFASSSSILEIVEGCGLLIKPFEKEIFCRQLSVLMDNKLKRTELSAKCIEQSKKYEEGRVLPNWDRLLNEMFLNL